MIHKRDRQMGRMKAELDELVFVLVQTTNENDSDAASFLSCLAYYYGCFVPVNITIGYSLRTVHDTKSETL